MKKIAIITLLTFLLLLNGCDLYGGISNNNQIEPPIHVITKCEDNLVCFCRGGFCTTGLSCHRDEDLILKYCG